jgi:predicted transcriptional regulator of viral defense system
VLAHLEEHGRIKNRDVQALLDCREDKARRILGALRDRGVIELGSKAKGRFVFYVRAG